VHRSHREVLLGKLPKPLRPALPRRRAGDRVAERGRRGYSFLSTVPASLEFGGHRLSAPAALPAPVNQYVGAHPDPSSCDVHRRTDIILPSYQLTGPYVGAATSWVAVA